MYKLHYDNFFNKRTWWWWRPSFSSRRCTDLEQSSAAYHICSVTSRLLFSLEDILRTRNYCCRAREVTLSFMDTLIALTYLLTTSLVAFASFARGRDSSSVHTGKLLVELSWVEYFVSYWGHVNHKYNNKYDTLHSTSVISKLCSVTLMSLPPAQW